jgi:heme-degrading monooxygenase HmoA
MATTTTMTMRHATMGTPVRAKSTNTRARKHHARVVASADIMDEVGTMVMKDGMLARERYVASNRFRVQDGKGPKFEKRWANRPSRLSKLDGFRFFTLMRRVDADESAKDEPNYVSFTIWEGKDGFDKWRKGDAFKEAHGGGTIFGFMDMLVSSLMILKGGPQPAFYDALLPVSNELSATTSKWQAEDGWRQVAADGEKPVDADCFVAMNRFKVIEGKEAAFEKRWAERESELKGTPGFVTFVFLRRDAVTADDGFNYSTYTVWENRGAFDNWRANGSKKAHANASDAEPMFEGRPSVALYEGILALLSPVGA